MTDNILKPCKVVLDPSTPKIQLALSAELKKVIEERNLFTARSKKKFITALDELEKNDVEIKRKNRKEQAILEIFNTEASYLKQLELVQHYFIEPLNEKRILNETDMQCIFSNIENIYELNGALLNELKVNISNVAVAFSKMAPFFKLYSVYAYNFVEGVNRVQTLRHNNTQFAKFLDNQESRPEVQSKLSSLLITPVQRIPRYCLLLKQVIENTDEADPEYISLKKSIAKLEEIANHIDKRIDEKQNAQRLIELQQSLVHSKPVLIQANRRLIKEGVLMRITKSKLEDLKFYLILLSDILIWCKIKKDNIKLPKSLKCTLILPLHKCKIRYMNSLKQIKVTYEQEDFGFYEENGDCKEWFDAIQDAIKNEVNNRQSLRKQSSSKKAAFKDFEQYHNPGLTPDKKMRKRKRHDTENGKISKKLYPGPSSSEKFSSLLPPSLIKRKPLHKGTEIAEYNQIWKSEKKDVLHPLREHLMMNKRALNKRVNNESDEECIDAEDVKFNKYSKGEFSNNEYLSSNLFVFGKTNNEQHQGFRFKMSKLISDLSNSIFDLGNGIKNLFNFK